MPRPPRIPRCLAPLAVLLAVTLALAACAANATVRDGPVTVSSLAPTETLSPTFTPSPTATATPVRCGNTLLPTPTAYGPYAVGQFNGWTGVPALPGTLMYSDAARASDGVQVSSSSESLGLCTPGMTPDAVRNFYVTRLPPNGWATITTFPSESSCSGDCWKRDAGGGTTLYVALDHLKAADGATLYTLTRVDVHTN